MAQGPADRAPLAGYVDRLIEGARDEPVAGDSKTDDTAPPRRWVFESKAVTARQASTGGEQTSGALTAFGFLAEHSREYLNYGSFAARLQTSYRAQGDSSSIAGVQSFGPNQVASFRLINSGFPVTAEISASTIAGDTGVSLPSSSGSMPRISGNSTAIRGVSQSWTNIDDRWEANWGAGLRGNLQNDPFAGFVRWGGDAFWANGTFRFLDQGFAGAHVFHASSLSNGGVAGTPFRTANALGGDSALSSLLAIGGWGERDRTTGALPPNSGAIAVLTSLRVGESSGSGNGIIGNWRTQRETLVMEFGAQHVTADTWVNDRRYSNVGDGVSARYSDRTARHSWSIGASVLRSPTDASLRNTQKWSIGANWQWRIARDEYLSLDTRATLQRAGAALSAPTAGVSLPSSSYDERITNLSARYQKTWPFFGQSTFAVSAASNQQVYAELPATSNASFRWEQDWLNTGHSPTALSIRTIASLASERLGELRRVTTALGGGASWRPADGLTLNADVRYNSPKTNLALERGVSGSLEAAWRSNVTGLSAGLLFSTNQARFEPAVLQQDPNLLPFVRGNGWSTRLWVRYELAAGTFTPPVGIRQGRSLGAGELTGMVYLDENNDGKRQLDERGLPNVEIVLDGRSVARTDGEGRFTFPLVAVGKHRIALRLDSIPLPWESQLMSRMTEIELRGSEHIEFPLTRIRD